MLSGPVFLLLKAFPAPFESQPEQAPAPEGPPLYSRWGWHLAHRNTPITHLNKSAKSHTVSQLFPTFSQRLWYQRFVLLIAYTQASTGQPVHTVHLIFAATTPRSVRQWQ